jgi:L-seryl-tRNA(Ser) seleniumtransferase
MQRALLRQLPKVDGLLRHPELAALPRDLVVAVARDVIASTRAGILDDSIRALPPIVDLVVRGVGALSEGRLRPVINATGIVVHTNLGRAPWAPAVRDAAIAAAGYCNVEMDLPTGKRGGRLDGVRALARHLTGAEDAIVVNNCAAAVLLALTALAYDREVICSRGELVEIGGSFRVPDVIASGGARLVDVGTTNRTRIADFAAAVGPDTAVLLSVHPSNFRIIGFTEAPKREELVALAHEKGLVTVEDVGSGSLDGERGEPGVRAAVAAGVDVVLFSGDKLLGGPQAGLCIGKRDAIQRLRDHPMYRALRVDKVILAAVERTLAEHAAGRLPPVPTMLAMTPDELIARASDIAEALAAHGITSTVAADTGYVGGGALPGRGLPTQVVRIPCEQVDAVARALRVGRPAAVGRIADGALVLDARTVRPDQVADLAGAVASALSSLTEGG